MRWVWFGAAVIVLYLFMIYAVCRMAAMADLHKMREEAAKPKPPLDPWERPIVRTVGVYDCEGDF